LSVIVIVILLDLYFIIQVLKKIISFYYEKFIFILYIEKEDLIRFSFVRKIVENKNKKNLTLQKWKKLRDFVIKFVIYR
jgi:hypothetical protein